MLPLPSTAAALVAAACAEPDNRSLLDLLADSLEDAGDPRAPLARLVNETLRRAAFRPLPTTEEEVVEILRRTAVNRDTPIDLHRPPARARYYGLAPPCAPFAAGAFYPLYNPHDRTRRGVFRLLACALARDAFAGAGTAGGLPPTHLAWGCLLDAELYAARLRAPDDPTYPRPWTYYFPRRAALAEGGHYVRLVLGHCRKGGLGAAVAAAGAARCVIAPHYPNFVGGWRRGVYGATEPPSLAADRDAMCGHVLLRQGAIAAAFLTACRALGYDPAALVRAEDAHKRAHPRHFPRAERRRRKA